MELIAVVMGCETSAKRFAACKSLLDYGFANYALAQAELPGQLTIPVKLGTANVVTAVPSQEQALLIDKAQKNLVSTQVELDPEVTAPVSKGQRLGTATVKAGEQVLCQIPLVAEVAVERLSWGQIFTRVLRQLCMAGQ
jgi:D-alanyl-D-alanine carboxypeptidase (penicillin-binding protein 5/6)